MSPGATAERVYRTLKDRILASEFRPGDRLDPAQLARPLASSATPVREALYLLVGDELVEMRANVGFFLPSIDAPALQDLYAWTADIALLAITHRDEPLNHVEVSGSGPSDRATQFFLALASGSACGEHGRAMARANARLSTARLVETELLAGINEELVALVAACRRNDIPGLRRMIRAYSRRRHKAAASIVRLIYKQREPTSRTE